MRKLLAVACVLALTCSGCLKTLQREVAFHDGIKQEVLKSGLLDEYEAYLEADPVLGKTTKKIRKGTATAIRALIAEQEKAFEKDD